MQGRESTSEPIDPPGPPRQPIEHRGAGDPLEHEAVSTIHPFDSEEVGRGKPRSVDTRGDGSLEFAPSFRRSGTKELDDLRVTPGEDLSRPADPEAWSGCAWWRSRLVPDSLLRIRHGSPRCARQSPDDRRTRRCSTRVLRGASPMTMGTGLPASWP